MSFDDRNWLSELAFGEEAGAFVGDPVVSVLLGVCSGVRSAVAGQVAPDDRRGPPVLASALVEELEPVAPHLAFFLDRLTRDDPARAPTPPDGFAAGRGWATVRLSAANPAVRPLLRNAFVRLFDPAFCGRVHAEHSLVAIGRLAPPEAACLAETAPDLAALCAPLEPLPPDYRPPWNRRARNMVVPSPATPPGA